MSERYIVQSVTGFTINQGSGSSGGGRRPANRSFAVLDSAVCYRIMGEFLTHASSLGERANERLAHRLCEKLNAEDDER